MDDRISLYPGRVKLTPVSGQDNTYDIVRADSPTQEGTPLNKATLLKDTTAALYGLGTDAVPDEVFNAIQDIYGRYYLYHWRKTVDKSGWYEVRTPQTQNIVYAGSGISSVYYADSITFDGSTGAVSLVSPTENNSSAVGESAAAAVDRGKPLLGKYVSVKTVWSDAKVYYISPDAVLTGLAQGSDDDGFEKWNGAVTSGGYLVASQHIDALESTVVRSKDRNAYPDSGEKDGATYEYLGVPFEKFPTMPETVTGHYIGTGTYGSTNKNKIVLPRKPSIVFIIPYDYDAILIIMPDTVTGVILYPINDCSIIRQRVAFEDGELSWWVDNTAAWGKAEYQHNYLGTTYHYLALC